MKGVAKVLQALGIICVMLGLVQGIQTDNMWIELYLSLLGIGLFVLGWGMEKLLTRKQRSAKS